MHLGIFAKTFVRPTLEETLDAVASHGLTHVQFNMSCAGLPTLPDRIDEDLCVSIARALKDRGITMAAISGTFNLCDPDAGRLEDNLRRLDVLAAACRWLDTRIITLCTGTRDPNDMWRWHPENVRKSTWETLVDSVRRAVAIVDRHEVILAFEPELHNVVNSVSKARGLLDAIDSRWLRVVIDPANLINPGERWRLKEVLNEAFDWLGPDIVLAHAKDPRFDERADAAEAVNEFLESDERRIFFLSLRSDLARAVGVYDVPPLKASIVRRIFYTWGFYQPYLSWLKKNDYAGAVVMHGLEERDVADQTAFLQAAFNRAWVEG